MLSALSLGYLACEEKWTYLISTVRSHIWYVPHPNVIRGSRTQKPGPSVPLVTKSIRSNFWTDGPFKMAPPCWWYLRPVRVGSCSHVTPIALAIGYMQSNMAWGFWSTLRLKSLCWYISLREELPVPVFASGRTGTHVDSIHTKSKTRKAQSGETSFPHGRE